MSGRRPASRPEAGEQRFSYDVQVWKIRTYDRKKGKTYGVRWAVAGKEHHHAFATYALADAFRSKLVGYQRKGAAFDIETGLPEPMMRDQTSRTWCEHMSSYIDAKWPLLAPKSRKSIADALTTATIVLLATERGRPKVKDLREAVYSWICVAPARADGKEPPAHLAEAVTWLMRNTVGMAEFQDRTRGPELTRKALDALAVKLDGTRAAPNTIARRRAALYNALDYAVEVGVLSANPIDHVRWKLPKKAEAIDPQAVISLRQGQRLLEEVGKQAHMGERLVAFFACMMYAGLRPAEAIALRDNNMAKLPESGWGEFRLRKSTPRSGVAWSDTGMSREDRSLKHRAEADTRVTPIHPLLVAILREHIERFGFGVDGRLFAGPLGGLPAESQYLAVWSKARKASLTAGEYLSLLARRPYDLRHFALSYWLNSGVPATQVAEWAGNSVGVLLRTYAKCILGQDEIARRRVEQATTEDAKSEAEPD